MKKTRIAIAVFLFSLLFCIALLLSSCSFPLLPAVTTAPETEPPVTTASGHLHEPVIDAAIAPTCAVPGKTEGSHCESCGEVLTAQQEVPATGAHRYTFTYDDDYHYRACQSCTLIDRKAAHRLQTEPDMGEFCSVCGMTEDGPLTHPENVRHTYLERPYYEYYLEEATETKCASYLTACICGATSRSYRPSKRDAWDGRAPESLTVTLYDTESEIPTYGFTWNSEMTPYTPVLQIRAAGEEAYTTYPAEVFSYSSYEKGVEITLPVMKVSVPLVPGVTYTYRIADLCSGEATEEMTITGRDPSAESFRFASFSDTQDSSNSGENFGRLLALVSGSDFLLHTGDICEDTSEERYWKSMLDANRRLLSSLPMMITAGNHDTTYKSGKDELMKHFHQNIPEQSSTEKGFFYSFDYGNARFIVLNTNLLENNCLPEEQYDFLVDALETNDKTWTIVSLHNPLFSVGNYGSTRNTVALALRDQLSDLFAEYGVDLVIQGHDHTLSKTHPIGEGATVTTPTTELANGIIYAVDPEGPIYIMNGPSGHQTRNPEASYEEEFYEYATSSVACSFAEYTIEGNRLTVSVKYYDATSGTAETYTEWGIIKN